jgi:hypothetical protein
MALFKKKGYCDFAEKLIKIIAQNSNDVKLIIIIVAL